MEDLDLVRRLEAAAVRSWPATVQHLTPEGWLLRATPGPDRARSNNALTPCRELAPAEIPLAIDRVCSFAREHSIRPGIQVSPTSLHGDLQRELDRQGWATQWPTSVLTGPGCLQAPSGPALTVSDHATPAWLRAWALCEPGRDVPAHARTVFELLRGRAAFARIGAEAVGILVETDGLAGMFCLAVDPSRRRGGLGTALVRGLLSRTQARVGYLQVEEGNDAARGLYGRLGFAEAYRYSHRTLTG
jgi:ribosomal protein S18 acetylase RimI-like enzyme